jgi:ABC-2 type transport system permease protein
MNPRILAVIKKEFRQIYRDKTTLGILLVIPSFTLVMFGYALNFDVKHIPLAILDEDNSQISREYSQKFYNTEYFDYEFNLENEGQIDELIACEKARVALRIPTKFGQKLAQGEDAEIQVIVDGANANAAATAVGYIGMITQNYSQKMTIKYLERKGWRNFTAPIDFRPRIWYNPELRSAKFLIPGLIGFNLMVMAVISTALSVVREKERGTMEQIIVSPLKPSELIIGKTIPYVFTSAFSSIIIILASYIFFGVEIEGSLLLLTIIAIVFLVCSLGYGLLISTLADTQQVAFMMSIITTLLPAFILSGFVFPIRNMPVIVQAITYFMPIRYFLVALRSVVIKGVGLSAFWKEALALVFFALLMIALSSLRLKREMS